MKKFSVAVCVCAVLFSFSNYGEMCERSICPNFWGRRESGNFARHYQRK